ncbi:hypothetical protein BpHYR1_017861 [Brachionus plicatilis]|uniref:Uncharacterized protein n=1 Tax=Brachionus plicatilis TaxID=10195 RepID=A0A3M7QYQ9_BRAPC|nr:hypothetical protein BpHYR1_017861 [Brachionus plicatilis]
MLLIILRLNRTKSKWRSSITYNTDLKNQFSQNLEESQIIFLHLWLSEILRIFLNLLKISAKYCLMQKYLGIIMGFTVRRQFQVSNKLKLGYSRRFLIIYNYVDFI